MLVTTATPRLPIRRAVVTGARAATRRPTRKPCKKIELTHDNLISRAILTETSNSSIDAFTVLYRQSLFTFHPSPLDLALAESSLDRQLDSRDVSEIACGYSAEWGVDWVKVDNCDYGSWADLIASQRAMSTGWYEIHHV